MEDKENTIESPAEENLSEETGENERPGAEAPETTPGQKPENPVDTTTAANTGKTVRKYTKEQLCGSKTYKGQRDLLNALLKDGEKYTKAQVGKLVKDYLKKEVN